MTTPAPAPAPQSAPVPNSAPAAPVVPPEAQTPAPTPAPDDRAAQKLAVLAKREAAAVKAQAAAREEAARVAAQKAEVDRFNALKNNPNVHEKWAYLQKELGLTYEQVTQLMLNGGQPTTEMQIQQLAGRIEASEAARAKEREDAAAAETARRAAAAAEATQQFRAAIDTHVADKTAYPMINHFGQSSLVFDAIEHNFNQTGKVMDIGQAAKLVESYLVDQVKKSQELLAPPAPAAPPPAAPPKSASPFASKPKTLTNTATAPTTTAKPKWRSDDERVKAALAKYASK